MYSAGSQATACGCAPDFERGPQSD